MATEKIIIPSNEEVLEVKVKGDTIDVTDIGNVASAKVIESDSKEL